MDHPVSILRRFITQEVFVPRGKEYFVPEGSSWIMDFRRVCLDPHFLDAYTEVFYERFKDQYPFQVGGMEVAAIPLIAAIIMKMRERGKPVNGFFIRKSRKKTGLLKMIEGKLTDDPVILVDDLINNGYTLDRQLKVMAEAGKRVTTFFTLLRFRSIEAYRKYTKAGIQIDGLFGLDTFTTELGTKLLLPSEPVAKENFTVNWYFKTPGALLDAVMPKAGIALDQNHVYLANDRGLLFALDRVKHKVVWEHRIGFGPWASKQDKQTFSTPLLAEGRLYFGAYDGNVYCLDAKTGKRRWVSFAADWVEGGVVLSERYHLLIVPTLFGLIGRTGGIVALDQLTGKEKWHASFPERVTSTSLVLDAINQAIVGTEGGKIYALDLTHGRILWTFGTPGAVRSMPAYAKAEGLIIVASYDGTIYALRVSDGQLKWRFNTGLPNHASPWVEAGRVFVTSLDKHLYTLDIKTGQKLWSFMARARIFSSPRVCAGKVYFGANDARLYELDSLTGKQTGFFQVTERITNPVVFDPATQEYFLTTYANEVFCLKRQED